LEQDVKHVWMCFFYLVEKDDRVGSASDGFGELTSLLVADVAWRRSDEFGDIVTVHIFGHVESDHRFLIIEKKLCQTLGEFGLTDSRRPQKEK
jgi:hypothetical protein